jgi:hypothetical protein
MQAMKRLARSLSLLAVALSFACGDEATNTAATPPPPTPTAITATPASAPPKAGTGTAITGVPGPTSIAALNGLRCVGQWRNNTFGSTGAFAARVEAGGAGGALFLEVGGNVFGGSGGVVELPFRLVDNQLEVEAHSQLLGHVSARIGLDGRATGSLQGPAALGPKANVTLTDYSFANNTLRFGLNIDFGDGRPPAQSTVQAACSR